VFQCITLLFVCFDDWGRREHAYFNLHQKRSLICFNSSKREPKSVTIVIVVRPGYQPQSPTVISI